MINEFQEAMHSCGIICKEPIIADGQLRRFANNGKGDKDGWLVFHGHYGAYGDWSLGIKEWWSSNKSGLSPDEKKRLNKQIESDRRKFEEERSKQQEATAQEALQLWAKLGLAGSSPYLESKKVEAHGARFGKESIVVPLYDVEDKLWSLQIIYHNGDKIFLKGGRKKGCFYPLGSLSGTETLFICEGFATGASIYQATQIPTVVAFDATNLEPVIYAIRSKFPDKQIIICADNDKWKDKNVGIESAKAIAAKYNYKVVWPEFSETVCKDNKPTDFNDLHILQGLEEVKTQISKASQTLDSAKLPVGFTLSKEALHFNPQEGEPIWVCSPLDVLAYTRDEYNQNWGRLVQFQDLEGYVHTLAIPMELLKGDCTDFFGLLLSYGLHITSQKRGRLKLPEYLQNIKLNKFATCTSRIGWYENCFIMPDGAIPETDEIYLQSDNSYFSSFQYKGTLEEWQEHIALPCQGNSRLIFALSCAFAAPLFPLLHEESGGFNLKGASSIGKSTALAVAASVWGSPKYIQQWKATGNALEAVAEAHNHTLLCLDELGQVNGIEAGEIAYMLANGSGKNRLKAKGGLRKKFEWKLLFLSRPPVKEGPIFGQVSLLPF